MAYRLPSLNALRGFEAAARHLSFKRAAHELSVTPTAISHLIRGLEDTLGIALFRRLTRAIELTPEGEAMLPKVREGMECFVAAVERARVRASGGALLISAPPSFASRWLVPRLGTFTGAWPQIRLHLASSLQTIDSGGEEVGAGSEGLDRRADACEVSVRFGTGKYRGCRVEHILASSYLPVCSPALLRLKRPLQVASDIRDHVLIHDDTIPDEHARPTWAAWCRLAGVAGVDTEAGPHFSDSGLALSAAIDGIGIALASRALTESDIAAGRLVAPFDIAIGSRYAYYFVAPEAIADRPEVAAFRNWLLAATAAGSSADAGAARSIHKNCTGARGDVAIRLPPA